MTFSATIIKAVSTLGGDLQTVLESMVSSADINAIDTNGDYEEIFTGTWNGIDTADHVEDIDEDKREAMADLARAWMDAWPDASKLSEIESVAAKLAAQAAEIELLKAQLNN